MISMTFSNRYPKERAQHVIQLPYDNPGMSQVRKKVDIVSAPTHHTVNPVVTTSNNEYIYYMKTSMLGRIMNNTACIMCPKQ